MRQDLPSGPGLLLLTTALLGFFAAAAGACGSDDDPAGTTTSGTGGAGTGGDAVGGIMSGPSGPGGGMSDGGGGEGGTGEVTNVWGEVLGGAGSVFPKGVAIDSAGNIVVVGAFANGSIDLGGGELTNAGGDDIFVAKFDSSGNHVWSQAVGAGDDQGALGVAVDSQDAIVLSGTFRGTFSFPGGPSLDAVGNQFSDAFVAKLDSSGAHVFSARYGIGDPYSDAANAVATNGDDDILVTGRFQNSIDFGGGTLSGAGTGDFAVFLAALTSAGAHSMSSAYGDAFRQEGSSVAASTTGAIALAGYSLGNVDFGGGELTTDQTEQDRAFVARFDESGNHVFSALGKGGEARATGVAFDGDAVVVAGNFKAGIDFGDGAIDAEGGNDDIFVTRFDASGAASYHRRFGDVSKDQVAGLAIDSAGFAVIAGTFDGDLKVNFETTLTSMASVQDAYLMRLGPSGNGYAAVSMRADTSAQAEGVAIDPNDDSMVVVGRVSGNVDFGAGPVAGSADLFIAKFEP